MHNDNNTPRRARLGLGAMALVLVLMACTNPDRNDQRMENTKEWGNETKEEGKTQMNEPR